MTPCESLDFDARAARVASFMFVGTSAGVFSAHYKSDLLRREPRPGYCIYCGAKLKHTWRAVRYDGPGEDGQPKFTAREATHAPEELEAVEKFRARPADEWGLRKGFNLAMVRECSSLYEGVHKEAKKLLEQRWRETRKPKEDAGAGRRQKAARRLGGE